MLKSHERFYSANGKRLVLVADDEWINRQLLEAILQDRYELIFAEDGQQTLDAMRENRDSLSLVLLDIMMPVLSGTEVLKAAGADPEISQIPIVVITSDQDAEVESLTLGAIDFIPKPYPRADVILARVRRTIELSEDRQIINSTERDPLTGLYNKEFFYRYAEQYDQHHKGVEMDAIVVDVNHFHMINDRFGTAYGDTVLRGIGEALRAAVSDIDGIVCRREADTFLVYCPHGKEYGFILENASAGLSDGGDINDATRIWLRMGVYANVDKQLEVERRFDRAKMAADTVQGSFTKRIGIYDSALRERELYSEQLIGDFAAAVRERQFQIHYQPKFDVQPEIPVLASAEALVRWKHPELGMISPGVFIPLFEDNGLIQQLDMYVWREAACQVKAWKEKFGFVVPVSVNVSRIDMYDPHLVDDLLDILHENDLSTNELLLEITESAYTQDSEQIIETVDKLRALGFKVEMDDFGTGYSSLNMISTLPIDALKLDMMFIRNAFGNRADTRMLEIVIDIANYLSVPVIAEGVETEEQMIALREMGCDFVQGYYFSRPLPADEYEAFVAERSEHAKNMAAGLGGSFEKRSSYSAFGEIAHALSSGFEYIYYVDTESNHYVEFSSEGSREDLQIEDSGPDFFEDMMQRVFEPLWHDDRMRVEASMNKDALLAQLDGGDPFFMTYRKDLAGEPAFFSLKAVKATTHDDHHIVIGISDVSTQLQQMTLATGSNELNFSSLAQALSADMESIYYVDVISDSYLEFKADGHYRKLELQLSGQDFFMECTRNILEVVYRDDQERVAAALGKDDLLAMLNRNGVFTMAYRLVIDESPLYYSLKAVWADEDDRRHVIIGVTNVDAQITESEKLEAQRRSSVTYASIVKALALDYITIYYVNAETNHFIEYSSNEQYGDLGIEKSGDEFFELSRENIARVAHPDDVEMFLSTFTKENVMAALDRDKTFTLTYRLMFGAASKYVHLKATRMSGQHDSYLVIGVSDVDDQIRREHEYARALRMANQDALTGVKSMHAYMTDERKINQSIESGEQVPFAVAVCDVDHLREINDAKGHSAGDRYLKDACIVVCNVFKRSPVYRTGSDEFVVVLRGPDYDDRERLMGLLEENSRAHRDSEGVSVTGGISEYRPGEDASMASVFERADANMYENKKRIKAR